jgi:hypothetical protein
MTENIFTPSRRTALQLFGASAAITAPGISLAASSGTKPLLTLWDAALAWPEFHRLASFEAMPAEGDRVFLEGDVHHPNGGRGIAVMLRSGEPLGFVTNQHHAALNWAMQRSADIDARISTVRAATGREGRVPGWGAYRVDIVVREQAAFV